MKPWLANQIRQAAKAEKERRRVRKSRAVKPVVYVQQTPWPKQKLFLDLDCLEAFYGGAAGPGKSSALLMAALQYVEDPRYSALLVRRTYQDLAKPGALMDRAHEWLRGGGCSWNEQKKQWRFPSGATLSFGYMETENDKYQYQGAEYQFIGPDEVTQLKESQYTYLFSRLRRLKESRIPIRMRPASNPGGVGAGWVHERFIPDDFTPDMAAGAPKVFWKDGVDSEGNPTRRAFVPARLEDNPALDYDEYVQSLNQLDPVTREQLLHGDWQITERGNIYPMWDERIHVITWSEFARVYGVRHIPKHWELGVGHDWGFTEDHPACVTWVAKAAQNGPLSDTVFVYRTLTTWNEDAADIAEKMRREMSPNHEVERVKMWPMSHEAASERAVYKRRYGLPFTACKPGPNVGIAQVRDHLHIIDRHEPHPFRPSSMGRPRLFVVVDDVQFVNPKDDRGMARLRAEFAAYHYAETKSGEPLKSAVPYHLFNDAMDSLRYLAAAWFPRSAELTPLERRAKNLAPELQKEELEKIEDPVMRDHAEHSRQIHLRRMEHEEKAREQAAGRFALPRVKFRK